jgi:hypothetical protein
MGLQPSNRVPGRSMWGMARSRTCLRLIQHCFALLRCLQARGRRPKMLHPRQAVRPRFSSRLSTLPAWVPLGRQKPGSLSG